MRGRDLVLTGVPRGGTTLACRLLSECDDTFALFEPMDVASLSSNHAVAVERVVAFFQEARLQLQTDGTATTKHRDGTLPDNPFDQARGQDGRRSLSVNRSNIPLGRPGGPFNLVIKHNAAFCALLPELTRRFEALAIVRNPLAVLCSWQTVDLPVSDGRVPAGERLDQELAARLASTRRVLDRQCILVDWFFSRFDRHLPANAVLRYEDVVETKGRLLRERAGVSGHDRADLEHRNRNALYAGVQIRALADALLARAARGDAAWLAHYDATAIASLADAFEKGDEP